MTMDGKGLCQTAGWIKMPLGTEVNLGPGDVVLDGVAAPPPLKGHSPSVFGPCLLWPRSPITATAELLFKIYKGYFITVHFTLCLYLI